MELPLYQIDAFANHIFEGNPAAVCPLTEWLPDELMQDIAQENNLAETAFFVPTAEGFYIRWFTPLKEVDLCGHATLASAYVLFSILEVDLRAVAITARSTEFDFVSRLFAPKYGINEDPVTGSLYTQLTPYWSETLNKLDLHARQASSRGGEVFCTMAGNRVKISGKAVKYMEARISI